MALSEKVERFLSKKAFEKKLERIQALCNNEAFVFFFLLALSIVFYWLALWYRCPYGQLDPCRKWIVDENGLLLLLGLGTLSLISFNYLYYSIVFTQRYSLLPYGIFWAIAVVVAWNSGNGYDFIEHGGYNRLVLAGSLSFLTLSVLFWKLIDYVVAQMQKLPYVKPHHYLKTYLLLSLCSVFFVTIIIRNNEGL